MTGVQTCALPISTDLWLIGGVALLVLIVLGLFHKELELTSYDPTHARVIGIRADFLRLILLGLLALAVVAGIQAVGVILTNALLVTPAAAAALLSNRFPRRMIIAAGIAVLCAAGGLYASFVFQVSSGASIVLACTAAFALAALAHSVIARPGKQSP